MKQKLNSTSLDTVCAALCYAMGIEAPAQAAAANEDLCAFADEAFGGKKADRVVMFNPDAIGQWVDEKYRGFLETAYAETELRLPLQSVMPSVTPVCFGTMYTGAQPVVHGIQAYEKPVIRIDTIFDALIRAGKKPVILGYGDASLSRIYLEREMDYFHFDTVEQVNAKAAELLMKDEHDFYVIYNGNYDTIMHRWGPESVEALAELRANAHTFSGLMQLIRNNWQQHRTLFGFAMDHGCHEIDGKLGSHGLDMPEDLNIAHLYGAICGESAT